MHNIFSLSIIQKIYLNRQLFFLVVAVQEDAETLFAGFLPKDQWPASIEEQARRSMPLVTCPERWSRASC